MEGLTTHTEKTNNATEVWLQELQKVPHIPATVRNTLGKENIKRFIEIITSESATEAEALCLAGELKPEEASQYWYASGEFTACKSEVSNLVATIAAGLKPQLASFIEKEIKGYKNEGVTAIFRSLLNLVNARYSMFTKHPSHYQHQIALTSTFYAQTSLRIAIDVAALSEDHAQPEAIRKKARAIVKKFESDSESIFGVRLYPEQIYKDELRQSAQLSSEDNLKQLDALLGYSGVLSDHERTKMLEEINDSLKLIQEEIPYKKFAPYTLHEHHPQIFFIETEIEDKTQDYFKTCFALINFSNTTIPTPTLVKDPRIGASRLEAVQQEGVVDLNVDPMTGDIKLNGLISEPLERILSHDRYLYLKHYILQEFASRLASEEMSFEDFFDHFEPTISHHDNTENTQNEDVPSEGFAQPSGEHTTDGESFAQDAHEQTNQEVFTPEHAKQLTKHEKNVIMRAIQSARAEDILQAMRTLCGKETRIAGSHHIFKSPRTGVALTLPRHSRTDKKSVSFRLVLENLRISGFSLMEFTDALGVKLPKDTAK